MDAMDVRPRWGEREVASVDVCKMYFFRQREMLLGGMSEQLLQYGQTGRV